MNIFILNQDEPHYSISLCFSCGFLHLSLVENHSMFGGCHKNVYWVNYDNKL